MSDYTYKVEGLEITFEPTVEGVFQYGGNRFSDFFKDLYNQFGNKYTYIYKGNLSTLYLAPWEIKRIISGKLR